MKGRFWMVLYGSLFLPVFAFAGTFTGWAPVSSRLPENDIRWVSQEVRDPNLFYAVSSRRVYKSGDGGTSWAQVFGLWGFSHEIRSVYADPFQAGKVYLTATNGVWASKDAGKNWNLLFRGTGGDSADVFCIAANPENLSELWLGTGSGLYTVEDPSAKIRKIEGFPEIPVYSIFIQGKKILVLAADGIYRSDDRFRWEKVLAFGVSDAEENDVSQETGSDGTLLFSSAPNLIYRADKDLWTAPTPRGIYQQNGASGWRPVLSAQNAAAKINFLCASPGFFYLATDRGVYRWETDGSLRRMNEGLGAGHVSMILYDVRRDRLIAATSGGIYQCPHPDGTFLSAPKTERPAAEEKKPIKVLSPAVDLSRVFEKEPTISDIQKAAIEYAEVHPRKIAQWRHAAALKAWLPTLSFYKRVSRNRNVDIDRGGTADPDKFIQGPDELGGEWTVDLYWNLGELIWNHNRPILADRIRDV